MDKEPDGPKAGAIVGLGLGMVVCCAGFGLLTAGALLGRGAWRFGGGLAGLGSAQEASEAGGGVA